MDDKRTNGDGDLESEIDCEIENAVGGVELKLEIGAQQG